MFINAVRFIRYSGKEQSKEREEMQNIVNLYRKKMNGNGSNVKNTNV